MAFSQEHISESNRIPPRRPQYPVHSDPDHQLLLRTVGAEAGSEEAEHSLYIKKKMNAARFGGTYEDYTMVQPAFVVVDRSGDVKQGGDSTENLPIVEHFLNVGNLKPKLEVIFEA